MPATPSRARPLRRRKASRPGPLLANLGPAIKHLRLREGVTQAVLAEQACRSKSFVRCIESGSVVPSLVALEGLLEALGVTYHQLSVAQSEAAESTELRRARIPRGRGSPNLRAHPVRLRLVSRLGRALRSLRIHRGGTQALLGHRTGFRKTTISNWERGATTPTLAALDLLAQCLGACWSDLEREALAAPEVLRRRARSQLASARPPGHEELLLSSVGLADYAMVAWAAATASVLPASGGVSLRPTSIRPAHLLAPDRLGFILHRVRESRGISLLSLAVHTDLGEGRLRSYERGDSAPTLDTLGRITSVLEICWAGLDAAARPLVAGPASRGTDSNALKLLARRPTGVDARRTLASLLQFREIQGWSRKEVARRAGVSPPTLANLELQATSPTMGTLAKVLEALGLTLSELGSLVHGHAGDEGAHVPTPGIVRRFPPDLLPLSSRLAARALRVAWLERGGSA